MREILFRAKSCYDWRPGTPWVYGEFKSIWCHILSPNATDNGCMEKRHDKGCIIDEYSEIEVLCDTVGQFTGCYDKNNHKIFEGDIVECVSWNEYFSKDGKPMEPFRRKMYVEFRNGGFKMIEKMPSPLEDHVWDIIFNGDIEIIGNVFDNPELLKKED